MHPDSKAGKSVELSFFLISTLDHISTCFSIILVCSPHSPACPSALFNPHVLSAAKCFDLRNSERCKHRLQLERLHTTGLLKSEADGLYKSSTLEQRRRKKST